MMKAERCSSLTRRTRDSLSRKSCLKSNEKWKWNVYEWIMEVMKCIWVLNCRLVSLCWLTSLLWWSAGLSVSSSSTTLNWHPWFTANAFSYFRAKCQSKPTPTDESVSVKGWARAKHSPRGILSIRWPRRRGNINWPHWKIRKISDLKLYSNVYVFIYSLIFNCKVIFHWFQLKV